MMLRWSAAGPSWWSMVCPRGWNSISVSAAIVRRSASSRKEKGGVFLSRANVSSVSIGFAAQPVKVRPSTAAEVQGLSDGPLHLIVHEGLDDEIACARLDGFDGRGQRRISGDDDHFLGRVFLPVLRQELDAADAGKNDVRDDEVPHVAGAAALLLAKDSTLPVSLLKSLLVNNVDILPQWNGVVMSNGRLNVFKALNA